MKRERVIQVVAAGVFGVSIAVAGFLGTRVSASAGRHQLVYTARGVDGQPIESGLGIAMGPFRGLLVNFLWIRANQMKEAGKVYESLNLAKAITALQPRYEEVWVFHAWNLAYNISVTAKTPAQRWEWVKKGLRLLREKGVVYNPDSMLIHKELGWIFLHKMGGVTDDANIFYKQEHAAEWTVVLGEPPRTRFDMSREEATETFAVWLEEIAEAPPSLGSLFERAPETRELVRRLRESVDEDLGFELLKRWTDMTTILGSPYRAGVTDAQVGPKSGVLRDLLLDPEYESAWGALLPYVRRKVLTDEYNMDPRLMVRYTRKYGPLDWRHAAAHALYWTAKGVDGALRRVEDQNRENYDFLNTDRQAMHAIQQLYRDGQVYFSYLYHIAPTLRTAQTTAYGGGTYRAMPNPYFVDTYEEIIQEVANRAREEDAKSFAENAKRSYRFYSAGYENFLKDAIRFFFRRGQIDKAQEYHLKLIRWNEINTNKTEEQWIKLASDLNDFIAQQFEDQRFMIPDVARSEIMGALQGAYINGLLAGDDRLFRQGFEYARAFHAAYTREQVNLTATMGANARMEVANRDFRWAAGNVFADVISMMNLEDAQLMYSRAPEDLKRFAYRQLELTFGVTEDRRFVSENAQAALAGRNFEDLFPMPSNYEAFLNWAQEEAERRNAPNLSEQVNPGG